METIHYISDFKFYSQRHYRTNVKYALLGYISYISREDENIFCFNLDKKKWKKRADEELKKRWDSRIALSFIMALPKDVNKDNIQKWRKILTFFLKKTFNVPEDHISLAFHLHNGISGEYNPHVHVLIYPRMKNNKKIDPKKNFLRNFHKEWDLILEKLGYKIRKNKDNAINFTTKELYSNKNFLEAYKNYVRLKKLYEGFEMNNKDFKQKKEKIFKYAKEELYKLFNEVKFFDPIFFLWKEKIKYTKTKSGYLINSPLREDKNPSFHIFLDKEKGWRYYDFATKECGSIIDLYMKFYGLKHVEALKQIIVDYKSYMKQMEEEKQLNTKEREEKEKKKEISSSFSSFLSLVSAGKNKKEKDKKLEKDKEKNFKLVLADKLKNPLLLKYLRKRKIENIPKWLKEVYLVSKDKKYFFIGIKDINGNYHLRNEYMKRAYKASDAKASFSYIDNGKKALVVCEGIFDALSLYQAFGDEVDYLILNSVSHVNDAIDFICTLKKKKRKIILALDHDEAGRKAEKLFIEALKGKFKILELVYGENAKDPNEDIENIDKWHTKLISRRRIGLNPDSFDIGI